jgi:PAS domain S-box-containing protein
VLSDITERKGIEKVQTFLAQTSSGPRDEPFFNALARYLAESLDADFICIDYLERDGFNARTVAVWCDGHFEDNVTYALKDTPCGVVVGKTVCTFPTAVCELFPDDEVLRDLRAESYVGVTLWSHTNDPIGLIAVIWRRPLANRNLAEAVMKLVAVRAAGEMERLEAEKALHENEELHRTILQTAMDGFWLVDMQGNILEVNEAYCGMSGYQKEELLAMNISELEVAEMSSETASHIQKVMNHGEDRFESRHRRKDGSVFEVEIGVQYKSSKGGQMVVFLRDITERKRMEEAIKERSDQLEDTNRELESFSYSVSHDLRAPLRAIDGYSRMIMKKFGDVLEDEVMRLLTVIRSNAERMEVLINELLSFARVQKTDMKKSEIDMDALARQTWNEIQEVSREREFELKIAEMLPGYGDPALIKQVLLNLISNAVKFTKHRRPGIIEMGSYEESNKVVYRLSDNGAGFNMAYYDKLFGVFQRLHGNEHYEGTGIGLAIVQRIIKRHGGQVWAEGEEDKGATFYFALPQKRMD